MCSSHNEISKAYSSVTVPPVASPKKVAKIVHCGEPKTLTKSKKEAADDGGLSRCKRDDLSVVG
jgi:hypothetical protein